MKANVTWSIEEDAKLAGKTCAKKAVLDLVQTKVAIMFSSVKYNTQELLNGAKEVLGTAPIIGCTSNEGIIVPDGFINSKTGFVGMMALGDNETNVGTAGSKKLITARETGKYVAKKAMEKVGTICSPSYFLMIANPGEEEEYAKGIQDVIGDVPFFGGSSADDDLSGKWQIYTEEGIFDKGVAVAFFYTNKEIKNIFTGKYHETVNSGVITKITGKRQLDEIDGIQALKRYCEWTNKKTKDVKGIKLLTESILKPLAVKSPAGDFTIIRHPMNGNTDCTINLGNDLSVNTAIIQMQASKQEMISAPAITLRELKSKLNGQPVAYLMIHCGGRKMAIEDSVENLAKKVKQEAGDVPFIMPFTFGEYGRGEHTANLCGGLMISETAFCK